MVDDYLSADSLERRSPEHRAREVVLSELHYVAEERPSWVASIRSMLETQPDSALVDWDRGMAVIDSVAGTRPRATEAEVRGARDVLSPRLNLALTGAAFGTSILGLVGMAATVLALLFHGGPMLRAVGIEVQTGDGDRAGRLRCSARTAAAWSPFILWFFYTVPGPGRGAFATPWGLVPLVVGLVGVALSLRAPQRGPHDRIAGTYLVPR